MENTVSNLRDEKIQIEIRTVKLEIQVVNIKNSCEALEKTCDVLKAEKVNLSNSLEKELGENTLEASSHLDKQVIALIGATEELTIKFAVLREENKELKAN